MPDTTLSEVLKEAYASAPAGVIIHHTLELRHPAFSAPIRVVRDHVNLTATLEASAPVDASTAVLFQAFNFEFTKPDISPNGVPQMTVEIDNVNQVIVANLEAALTSADMIEATYREFISTDLSVPQNDPPIHMTIMNALADAFKVKSTAGFLDLINRRFPVDEYDSETFPGLVS